MAKTNTKTSSWPTSMIKLQALTLGTMSPQHVAKLCQFLPRQTARLFSQHYAGATGSKGTQATGGRKTIARGGAKRGARVTTGSRRTGTATGQQQVA